MNYTDNKLCVGYTFRLGPGATFVPTNTVVTPTKVGLECDNMEDTGKPKHQPYLLSEGATHKLKWPKKNPF